jgi:lysophospholipase L1-like esterase
MSRRLSTLLAVLALTGCGARAAALTAPGPGIAPPPAPPPPTAPPDPAGSPTEPPPPHQGKPEKGQELSRFYEKLRTLENGERRDHVRVMWMGDSHAAADFWSGKLRSELQGRFGNGGIGFVHLGYRDYRHDHVKLTIDGKWRMRPKGPATAKPSGDGAFGLGGILMGGYQDGPRVVLELADPGLQGPVHFDLCYKLRAPEDRLVVSATGAEDLVLQATDEEPPGAIRHIGLTSPEPGSLVVKYEGGSADLCGVVIESDPARNPGVVLDTLGINGARYATPLAWDEGSWQAELARRRPDLVILEYGTNEAGDYAPDYEATAQNLERLMDRIRGARAEADCLVISPTDRADAEERIPPMHAAIRASAEKAGCFFYDAYLAMGERGAMAKMRDEKPPRAHDDGIHMTIRGYREYGGKLADALLEGYGGSRTGGLAIPASGVK